MFLGQNAQIPSINVQAVNYACQSDSNQLEKQAEANGRGVLEGQNGVAVVADDDTVYEESYQNISNRQHPLLRIHKLTKRIQKDKKISNAERRSLKARRNIISFRLRQRRQETEQELVTKIIPELQTFVSYLISASRNLTSPVFRFSKTLASCIRLASWSSPRSTTRPRETQTISESPQSNINDLKPLPHSCIDEMNPYYIPFAGVAVSNLLINTLFSHLNLSNLYLFGFCH